MQSVHRSPSPPLPDDILGVETFIDKNAFDEEDLQILPHIRTLKPLENKKKDHVPVEKIRDYLAACQESYDWDSFIQLIKRSNADQLHTIIMNLSSLRISSRTYAFKLALEHYRKDDPQVRQVIMYHGLELGFKFLEYGEFIDMMIDDAEISPQHYNKIVDLLNLRNLPRTLYKVVKLHDKFEEESRSLICAENVERLREKILNIE